MQFLKYGLLTLLTLISLGLFANELKYQNRGNYHEGLRSIPVNAKHGIELLNLQIRSNNTEIPEYPKIRFFHPKGYEKVYLNIRDISGLSYYWLDKVKKEWISDSINDFSWPSSEVLKKLENPISLEDIGIVVRLGKEGKNPEEIIAPAMFTPTQEKHNRVYIFNFISRHAAILSLYYIDPRTKKQTILQKKRRVQGKVNFAFELDSKKLGLAIGWHTLGIHGYSTLDNSEIRKLIKFYHGANAMNQPK